MSSHATWSLRALWFIVLPSVAAMLSLQSTGPQAQTPQPKISDKPFVVEYYYKVRWGMADEFIRLFKKNHYPLLKKQIELGRILEVTAASPRYHGTEDGRWDYRVTIVWKNATVANDEFDIEPITKQLYPDQEVFKREEQTRFELLLAHWDLPITSVDLEEK
jgi:hypothetical protein